MESYFFFGGLLQCLRLSRKAASHYGSNILPQYKALWDQRKFVDRLVLMDWSSTSPDLQQGGSLEIFKTAIDKVIMDDQFFALDISKGP